MTFAVRAARPEEYAAVGALTAEAYRVDGLLDENELPTEATYEEKLLDAARRAVEAELWVAVDGGGEVLGTVTWCPPRSPWRQLALAETQAEFRMLSVAPAGRRRGVARALVEACLDRARSDGMTEMVIWSHPRMLGAHALYARMGFQRAYDLDGSPAPGVFLWGFRRDVP
ncbi:MAG TPA: GNAT family N-acetyltransferase [Propionibacteriaceae bacterium]|jgi:GNAT superfamily N-acetyltransferase|nr:GNAT family N-acetyltransferase [Propionibacteriaceae bacterium]